MAEKVMALPPSENDEIYVFPMSFAQQRMWILDQIVPDSPFYNIPAAVSLNGRLNVDVLEQTINEIVHRHETLRTTFAIVDDEPSQIIAPHCSIPLPVIDLQHLPVEERKDKAFELASEDARRSFNLKTGPLLRTILIQLGAEEYVFIFNMHHIISDGWSMGVFIAEIAQIYKAFISGQPSPLPPLSIQYADFTQWQRNRMQGKAYQEQLAYWKQKLGDIPAILELPTDHSRPAISTNQGATLFQIFPKTLADRLHRLSQQSGVTMFMTLLSAFQLLLHRYSNQEDICVGSPIANRTRSEVEQLIGLFINTLVFRSRVDTSRTFTEFLKQVRETALEAYAHQDIPFDTIVEAIQPERDMSYSPLFQVMFILQNTPVKFDHFSDLSLDLLDIHSGTSTFDLTLSITEGDRGMDVTMEYSTDLFEARTIKQMLDHFRVLLEAIVQNPDQPMWNLPLLTQQEERALLRTWNDNQRDYPLEICAHQLFEQQAQANPEALAAIVPEKDDRPRQEITYRALNARSNQLAHHLRSRGAGPGQVVGICVERSLEMIVGILGIMKSGAAYLPLDPMQPKDRLEYMIENASPILILTQQSLADNLPENEIDLIFLDSDWETIAAANDGSHNPAPLSGPNDPAYLIYTSGSTGRSKGVQVCNLSLTNAFFAWQDAYELRSVKVHLQMANFAFDVFSGDFVRALCSGGHLVICPRDWLLMPKQLYELIDKESVEIAEFVPAVLRLLMQYLEDENLNLEKMRLLICGSDVWYMEEYKKFARFCGTRTRLINSFGLTEATIDSSFYEASDFNIPSDQVLPIGRPFANQRMYILDAHQRPVPIGVPGELYIGGLGMAQGYYRNPDLSAERFLPDPFQPAPGAKIYKTGDLARYRPDGNVNFLGRLDHQVKIRGFRIEIGEIESILRQYSVIQDAVVVAAHLQTANSNSSVPEKRLVAYLVPKISVDRIPLYQTCRVMDFSSDNHTEPIEVMTKDISVRGVCLTEIPITWQKNHEIELQFTLPGLSEPVTIQGKVVWHSGREAGVMLLATLAQQSLIMQSIRHVLDTQGVLLNDLGELDMRVKTQSTCLVEFEDGKQEIFTAENISPQGICLLTESNGWKHDQPVKIKITDFAEDSRFHGRVWWKSEQRTYIRFEAFNDCQETVSNNMEKLLKENKLQFPDLRSFLKEKLPEYMVPATYILLDKLPLTSNGKVDRKSLPSPEGLYREVESEYVPPRTPVEEMLESIWCRLLGAQRISVVDNFFELGGHSLLATQLVSHAHEAFKVTLPLRKIFEQPTIIGLANEIEILQRNDSGISSAPIQPVERSESLPLSFAEQRLWFMDQLEPGSAFYNLPESFTIKGALKTDVLEKCLNEVIRRHEILRTAFVSRSGVPYRKILPQLKFSIPLSDISGIDPARQEDAVWKLASEEAQTPFDLEKPPLMRARLLRLSDEEHVILFTMHHIIGDDWSSNVLIQEIAQLYPEFLEGKPSPLPELPIQYADFAAWQRAWLSGEVLDQQLSYWKSQLADLSTLELPTDHPRPPVPSYNGSFLPFELPADLSGSLRALSQSSGSTLFMTLLAAFQVLLFRYSGKTDIPVGSPIANRNRADIENLIGFFVNTLVLRGDLSGDPSFIDLLARTRETALAAYAHQDLPFEMIVDKLLPNRNLSHSPLFEVMFVLQNAAQQSAISLSDLSLSPIEVHSGTAKFDLTLFVNNQAEALSGALEYNTDLFNRTTIKRMLSHFVTLLQAAVANPTLPISRLPILSSAERALLIDTWNDAQLDFPRHLCTHHLFEQQALRSPDAPALLAGELSLSYAELNARANQLAHYLQSLGVGPEVLVGVCMERSLEMIVALLGVLKSGAAYIPLDPNSPAERISFIIQDASMPVLLTQRRVQEALLADLSVSDSMSILPLDARWDQVASFSADNPSSSVTPENLAYVIYTSGSTGRPKGAMILHRGLVNYLSWCAQVYPVSSGSGTPLHSSFTFDLAVTSLFATLFFGTPVHLLPEELGVEALGAALQSTSDFGLIKITPAHLQLLSQQVDSSSAAACTRAFIIGGENLLVDHVHFWQRFAPDTHLVNEYGPTETVVGCCVYWAPLGRHKTGVIPIGRPIINTRLYILDTNLQPVPIGVPAELFIGGEGVARGYLNRPDLTAEKFLPDPFSSAPDARMYRTGDLVRILPDGNIECLGRIDFQVKIRGYRVELGEIESHLDQHELVKESVVWVYERGGVKHLVAYVVPLDPQQPGSPEVFKAYLANILPDYMVPNWYIPLEALPLSHSGKVNRNALPAPDFDALTASTDFAAPQSEKERILAGIWSAVLGISQVSVNDNFFELGGDSILSIQVIARARQAGLHLSPRLLFEHPTIAGLAKVAKQQSPIKAEQGMVTGAIPLTPIQRWMLEQNHPNPDHWNQSMILEISEPLDESLLKLSIRHLIQHHDALRIQFTHPNGSWQQENRATCGEVPLTMIELYHLSRTEQKAVIENIAALMQKCLRIKDGEVFRVVYFKLGNDGPDRLLMIAHHLVIDGVSWRILLEDFETIYQTIREKQTPQLPPKTTSFKEWSEALQDYAQSEAVTREVDFWTDVPFTRFQPLPVDFASTENTEKSLCCVTSRLSQASTHALLHEVPAAYHTEINEILMTALTLSVQRWTGSDTTLVNLEGHGREDISEELDISRTVGWFTTFYPVWMTVNKNDPLSDTIKSVKEQVRRIPMHGLGYGLLRYLNHDPQIKARMAQIPQAQISFNYLGQIDRVLNEESSIRAAQESTGAERCPDDKLPYLLDINCVIANEQLQIEWGYSKNSYREETIDKLARLYISALEEIIQHCLSPDAGGYTPSDVKDFGWSQDEIDDIMNEFKDMEEEFLNDFGENF